MGSLISFMTRKVTQLQRINDNCTVVAQMVKCAGVWGRGTICIFTGQQKWASWPWIWHSNLPWLLINWICLPEPFQWCVEQIQKLFFLQIYWIVFLTQEQAVPLIKLERVWCTYRMLSFNSTHKIRTFIYVLTQSSRPYDPKQMLPTIYGIPHWFPPNICSQYAHYLPFFKCCYLCLCHRSN